MNFPMNFTVKKTMNRGFTLIELLVVIAIIGILSSVVLASLNTARVKARVASAQSSAKSVQAAAIICMDDDADLQATPVVGNAICTGSDGVWPATPNSTWSWAVSDSDVSDGSFSFTIASGASDDDATITCTANSCTES